MKYRNLFLLFMILLCVAVFFGYRQYDAIQTDTRPPEITVAQDKVLTASVREPKENLLRIVTAQDNRDGDVTDSLVIESLRLLNDDGLAEVVCAAFDKGGNVAKATYQIQYTDYQPPRFSLAVPLIYRENANFDIMSVVGATDALDGDIQHRIRATMLTEESAYEEGTHYIQFKVNNSMGDSAELVLPVEVSAEAKAAEATVTLTEYLVYVKSGQEFDVKNYLDTFTHLGKVTSLVGGLPKDYSVKTEGTVNTGIPGVYPVDIAVTYLDRHETDDKYDQKYTGHTRLIVVVEG